MRLATVFVLFRRRIGCATRSATQVIQTETREVLVDAIVTAKNGAYVRDLTAKDFHLSQDGKEQAIKGFAVGIGIRQPRSRARSFCFSTRPAWRRGIRFRSARLPPVLSMRKRAEPYDGRHHLQRFRARCSKLHQQCRAG